MSNKYKLSDFIKDCAEGTSKAYVDRLAMATAKSDFKLSTQGKVLEFIGYGGLEKPHFINSKVWENNPDSNIEIKVDAYGFYSGFTYGYIAFFLQPKNGKWNIKSFKKNTEPDTRNLAFKEAFQKLEGQTDEGGQNEKSS